LLVLIEIISNRFVKKIDICHKYYIVFVTNGGVDLKENTAEKIKKYIKNQKNDMIFSAKDFIGIAEQAAIRQTLCRMAEKSEIKKVMRGLYYKPRYSELLQEYEAVSPNDVATAVARKFNWTIAPIGETALNILGLSTQVPAKWTYISDGIYKKVNLDNVIIEFKRRNNGEISKMSYKTALVIQGIKALGKDNIDEDSIKKLQDVLTKEEKETMLKEAKTTFAWIYQVIEKICGGTVNV